MPPKRKTTRKGKTKSPLALPPPPPPFRFQGARLKFLQTHVDTFILASAQGQGHLKAWFITLYDLYWDQFPWRLALDQNPFPGMRIDRDTDVLTSDETSERRRVVVSTQTKIRSFFHHARLMRARLLA
ncbi:hypothetical protein B0H11DRAFT_1944317 [Mycena galericulata]|nr:hypothetical protein B0H11DRAFT_1944317 [Mycena galericulata]